MESSPKLSEEGNKKPPSCLKKATVDSEISDNGNNKANAITSKKNGIYWNQNDQMFRANSGNSHVEEQVHREKSMIIGALDKDSLNKIGADRRESDVVYDESGNFEYFEDEEVDAKAKRGLMKVVGFGKTKENFLTEDKPGGDQDPFQRQKLTKEFNI